MQARFSSWKLDVTDMVLLLMLTVARLGLLWCALVMFEKRRQTLFRLALR